jgi:DNA-binding response OmpR family regulator
MKTRRKQIVIIEDDAVLRRGLRRVFLKENYEVFAFEDGKHGFEQISSATPDLILCDYKLPDTNGVEVLKELRKTDKKTPFFLMTGYFKEEISTLATENGANEVLEKPLDLIKLKASCKNVLTF